MRRKGFLKGSRPSDWKDRGERRRMHSFAMQLKTTDVVSGPEPHDPEGRLHALRDLIQSVAITKRSPGEPDFILASGKRSRYYCDTKKVTLSPEGSQLTGEALFALFEGAVEAIGGLELGATFIAAAVALVSWQHRSPIYGFTVRDEQKKHGTQEKIAESYHPDGRRLLCPGRRVVIVDDVVTGGGSILRAVDEVENQQCEVVAVVTLVDRNEGGGDRLRQRGLPYFSLFNVTDSGDLTISDDPRIHRFHPA
jgi:orotate phosphoribosyltransferase